MKLHEINKLNNFISGFYINKSACKKLIKVFEDNKDIADKGMSLGKNNQKIINKKMKDSKDLCLTPSPIYEYYFIELQKCMNEYIKQYPMVDLLPRFKIMENCNIQKYEKNEGFFKWHFERGHKYTISRVLVWMTYLNTVKKGGETEFKYQNLKVKPEEGLTLIWPSDWTHTHRGITSKTETKYIITGWYNLDFNDN